MFEDSVLENRIARKRRWTTLVSFALECAGIAILVLIPLFYTEALPNLNIMSRVEPPPAPAPPHVDVITTIREEPRNRSEFFNNVLIEPQRIPDRTNILVDKAEPVDSGVGDTIGIPGGTGPNSPGNRVITDMLRPTIATLPTLKSPTIIRRSHLDEGQIIRRVQPVYPAIARESRTQGAVVLEALIGKDGHIERLNLISGHPLLVRAAIDAVQQWRYRPYVLNGSPVEVQTTITVNFYLNSN